MRPRLPVDASGILVLHIVAALPSDLKHTWGYCSCPTLASLRSAACCVASCTLLQAQRCAPLEDYFACFGQLRCVGATTVGTELSPAAAASGWLTGGPSGWQCAVLRLPKSYDDAELSALMGFALLHGNEASHSLVRDIICITACSRCAAAVAVTVTSKISQF